MNENNSIATDYMLFDGCSLGVRITTETIRSIGRFSPEADHKTPCDDACSTRIVITSKITAHKMVLTTTAAAAIAKRNKADEFSLMRANVYEHMMRYEKQHKHTKYNTHTHEDSPINWKNIQKPLKCAL